MSTTFEESTKTTLLHKLKRDRKIYLKTAKDKTVTKKQREYADQMVKRCDTSIALMEEGEWTAQRAWVHFTLGQ